MHYHANPDPGYYQAARSELLPLFPPDLRTILEVGCGEGRLGRALRERGAQVWGVERNPDAARHAAQLLDHVLCGDVESIEIQPPPGGFDCIVYADVLEHLVDPWALLARQRTLLRPGGLVVASIPNIRYYITLWDLLVHGRWEYVDAGILDRTHLRFFTRTSIEAMFQQAGLSIVRVRRNIVARRDKRMLNRLLGGALDDFLTLQYHIQARRDGA